MKQALTPAQIDYLYGFVQQKGVKPLDVQIELVDHLATDIENTMSVSSELTFEESLK